MSVVANKTQIICMYVCMHVCMKCVKDLEYVFMHASAVFVYIATLSTYIFMYELHV